MDANIKKGNKILIETVIKNLKKRNITGHYCESAGEAAAAVISLIEEGSEVSWGGSVTLSETGIKDAVKRGNYKVIDPMDPGSAEITLELRRMALTCDVFLCSANAVTMDGVIVNIDGTGNRTAAIAFGPKKVIFVVGVNKIVADENAAVSRIKTNACPANCIRLDRKTPCAITGKCGNCLSVGNTICSHTLSTRFSPETDRMHVVFVNDWLGY